MGMNHACLWLVNKHEAIPRSTLSVLQEVINPLYVLQVSMCSALVVALSGTNANQLSQKCYKASASVFNYCILFQFSYTGIVTHLKLYP